MGRQSSIKEELDNSTANSRAKDQTMKFVACLFLLPEDSDSILNLFQSLGTNILDFRGQSSLTEASLSSQSPSEDTWLNHSEAAVYLGVSRSTLYHYSCDAMIERRKFAGRLQYRRSTLENFKQAHTLPASCRRASAHIIAAAHSSGK
jgi:hypothetical protein